jgi:predicted dithiol-disulfide oxidoreductase (DUF899 family)
VTSFAPLRQNLPWWCGYQLLDLTPKGHDEQDLPWTMAWVHRHDAY